MLMKHFMYLWSIVVLFSLVLCAQSVNYLSVYAYNATNSLLRLEYKAAPDSPGKKILRSGEDCVLFLSSRSLVKVFRTDSADFDLPGENINLRLRRGSWRIVQDTVTYKFGVEPVEKNIAKSCAV